MADLRSFLESVEGAVSPAGSMASALSLPDMSAVDDATPSMPAQSLQFSSPPDSPAWRPGPTPQRSSQPSYVGVDEVPGAALSDLMDALRLPDGLQARMSSALQASPALSAPKPPDAASLPPGTASTVPSAPETIASTQPGSVAAPPSTRPGSVAAPPSTRASSIAPPPPSTRAGSALSPLSAHPPPRSTAHSGSASEADSVMGIAGLDVPSMVGSPPKLPKLRPGHPLTQALADLQAWFTSALEVYEMRDTQRRDVTKRLVATAHAQALAARKEADALRASSGGRVDALQGDLQHRNALVAALEAQVESGQRQVADLQAKLLEATADSRRAEGHAAAVAQQMDASRAAGWQKGKATGEAELARVREELDAARAANAELRAELQAAARQRADADVLVQRRLEATSEEHAGAVAAVQAEKAMELRAAEELTTALQGQVAHLVDRAARLEADLDQARVELAAAPSQADVAALQDQVGAMEDAHKEALSRAVAAATEAKDAEQAVVVDQCREQAQADFFKRLSDVQAKHAQALHSVRMKAVALTGDHDALVERMRQAHEEELRSARADVGQLRTRVSLLEQELAEVAVNAGPKHPPEAVKEAGTPVHPRARPVPAAAPEHPLVSPQHLIRRFMMGEEAREAPPATPLFVSSDESSPELTGGGAAPKTRPRTKPGAPRSEASSLNLSSAEDAPAVAATVSSVSGSSTSSWAVGKGRPTLHASLEVKRRQLRELLGNLKSPPRGGSSRGGKTRGGRRRAPPSATDSEGEEMVVGDVGPDAARRMLRRQ